MCWPVATGQEERPVSVQLEAPTGSNWKVATQLHPAERDNVFSRMAAPKREAKTR